MSEHPSTRDLIISIIDENPGIHFREIQRRSGVAVGQLEYHLDHLERDEMLSIREDGNLKRYFCLNSDSYSERQILFYLRSSSSRDVLQKLAKYDFLPLNTLLRVRKAKLARRKKVIEEMANDGVIEVYNDRGLTQVRIRDRSKVVETARKYRESVLELLSESFISIVDDDG